MTRAAQESLTTGDSISATERATLESVCDTLFPSLPVDAGDNRGLFGTDAKSLGVPAAVQEALAAVPAEQMRDFRRLLHALENPLFVLTFAGRATAFRALKVEQRERLLLRMSMSSMPLARQGFQAMKRLAAFLFYSLMDERRENPTWQGIGYVPSVIAPASAAALCLTSIGASARFDADACIIGSGAGGGVIAAALAAAGKRVIVLEQGPGDQAPDFEPREVTGVQRLLLDRGTTATRDLGVVVLAGSCLGGGTTVNWQSCLPLPGAIREEWSRISGLPVFPSDEFTQAMDSVSAAVNAGVTESAINGNNDALRRGAESLGWRWQRIPRNARGCDFDQCGSCMFGCRRGAKQGTAVTFLADAQQRGDVTIVPNCRAIHVTLERGRATGVRAVAHAPGSPSGRAFDVTVRAPLVVVSAGGIETPALLLRSGIQHSALGRNLYLHPTSAILGVFPNAIRTWEGAPQTVLVDEFAAFEGNFGVRLEVAAAHPGLLAMALPWFGARDHRERMQKISRACATIALTRDAEGGRVRVRRDGRARITYRMGARESSHLRRGLAAAVRANVAAGAEEIIALHSRPHVLDVKRASARTIDEFCARITTSRVDRNWSPLFTAHQMGSCCMGADPRLSVCDERGAVRGVAGLFVGDASLFPASSGVNPMITVMAIAALVGRAIADRH